MPNDSMIVKWNKEILRYKAEPGTYFKVNGDVVWVLEVKGDSLDYVLYWIRERLRKLENGQIKVVKHSTEERDWEQEEKIKRQMWEDINVNTFPKGIDFESKVVSTPVSVKYTDCSGFWPEQHVAAPPKGPCIIS